MVRSSWPHKMRGPTWTGFPMTTVENARGGREPVHDWIPSRVKARDMAKFVRGICYWGNCGGRDGNDRRE